MRTFIFSVVALFLAASFFFAGELNSVQLPEMLKSSYVQFTKAMKSGDAGTIKQHCLPNAVNFSYETRKNSKYGQDLNIIFAKEEFDGAIASIRKDAEKFT